MSGADDAPVLVDRVGGLGRLTLNRPRAMNALSLSMVEAMDDALRAWADDESVRVVLVDGAGDRALCAGGDIRALHQAASGGEIATAIDFMAREYRMNARIANFPKPYVAFMDGIVMGGGIGVSAHGNVRLVTRRSVLAMPETSIGLFPDVGATWLLANAPGELGTHLALTGRRIGAADAILAGLADRCVPSDCRAALVAGLASCADHAAVGALVETLAIEAPAPEPGRGLAEQRGWIDRAYADDTVEAILDALDAEAAPEAEASAADIRRHSPTSLTVTLRALRLARGSGGLSACLEREFGIVAHALASADFREGVRAAVIDKDGRPRWAPASLGDIEAAAIDRFFVPPTRTLGLNDRNATAGASS